MPAKKGAKGKKKLGKKSMKRTKGGMSIAINPINPNTTQGTATISGNLVQEPGTSIKFFGGTQSP